MGVLDESSLWCILVQMKALAEYRLQINERLNCSIHFCSKIPHLCQVLTFFTLWANSADDKLLIFFLFFLETICMNCQICLLEKIRKICQILSVKERAFDLGGHFLGLWLLTHAFSSKDLICPFICVHMINHGSFGLKGKLINSDSNPC